MNDRRPVGPFRHPRALSTLVLALAVLAGAAGVETAAAGKKTLTVSASVSLVAPLTEAAERYEREHPDVEIVINAGASGVLVQQILRGAPADIIVTASSGELDRLAAKGMLADGTRGNVASNRLVVLVPAGRAVPRIVQDLVRPEFDLIAVANPETSPLGRYTMEVFEALYIAEAIRPRLVRGESAQQVLKYVMRGEVAAAITYETDARLAGDRVSVGPALPTEYYSPIVYQAAVLGETPDLNLALSFFVTFNGEAGRRLFEKYGFTPIP